MSTKQFISAEEHLAKLDVTVQQANDFIFDNIDNPTVLYEAAQNNAVTLEILSEITDFQSNEISEYFTNAMLDPEKLCNVSKLINSELGALESIVAFNNNTGILSTTSLKEEVLPLLLFNDSAAYDAFFKLPLEWQFMAKDGIYDAAELNVIHLDNVPASKESIESLFFGTLLNVYLALDQAELNQLNDARDNGSLNESQELLVNALTDSPSPIAWTDETLADLVVAEAADLVNDLLDDFVVESVGVLDQSFLGFLNT